MIDRPYITIHQPGVLTTDYDAAGDFGADAPRSFEAAQLLLVAADKCLRREGWFTSDKRRQRRVAEAYATLVAAMRGEGIFLVETVAYGNKHAAILYLNEFSAVFPNWQDVYSFLNEFVWDRME